MRDHERTPAHALHRGHQLAIAHGPIDSHDSASKVDVDCLHAFKS